MLLHGINMFFNQILYIWNLYVAPPAPYSTNDVIMVIVYLNCLEWQYVQNFMFVSPFEQISGIDINVYFYLISHIYDL